LYKNNGWKRSKPACGFVEKHLSLRKSTVLRMDNSMHKPVEKERHFSHRLAHRVTHTQNLDFLSERYFPTSSTGSAATTNT